MNVLFGLMFVIGLIFLAEGLTKKPWLTKMTNWIEVFTKRLWSWLKKATKPMLRPFNGAQQKLKQIDKSALKITKSINKHYRYEDIHVDPITWNLVYRPIFSLVGSCLVVTALWLAVALIARIGGILNPISGVIFLMLTVFGFLYFVRPEDETEAVPETKFGALVTFAGMPTLLIRTTGDYRWTGARLLLGRSRKVSKDLTVMDANGFIKLGPIPFQVWKSAGARGDASRSVINVPAKNRAEVKGSLTINFFLKKPRLWLDAENPELTLGDQSRQEYQEMLRDINDTDVAAIQPVMRPFLTGTPIITSFIPDSVNGHKPGAIIRDKLGMPLYATPEETETLEEAVARFSKKLLKEGDPAMLGLIRAGTKKKGAPQLRILQVSNPITEVLEALGAQHQEISFSDIELSGPVKEAAAQASSEADQRTSQLASARTQAESRKLRAPTPEELKHPEMLQQNNMLAAAQDNPKAVKVVFVPGNPLAAAAVAGALNIGADNK